MIYSKNYDKKEVAIGFDATREEKLPNGWKENDRIKVLGDDEYPIPKNYKRIN